MTFEQLYADLVAAHTDAMPERYFTLSQFRADTGLSIWVANKRLAAMVDNGELGTRPADVNGRSMRIWWFVG